MFVTRKRLKEEVRKIYESIEFNRENTIQNAVIEVELKDINPLLKELNKLEARIEQLEKNNK
jgi:ubiquinone biosynthesis protein UbiJ